MTGQDTRPPMSWPAAVAVSVLFLCIAAIVLAVVLR